MPFSHGSPAHDEDCITPVTPVERLAPMLAGIDERIVVSAHIHVQFDREVGFRSLNPGSVGLPYEGRPGAFWCVLDGGGVWPRRTEYDRSETYALYRATSDPSVERMVDMLERPAARDDAIEHAESVDRSG